MSGWWRSTTVRTASTFAPMYDSSCSSPSSGAGSAPRTLVAVGHVDGQDAADVGHVHCAAVAVDEVEPARVAILAEEVHLVALAHQACARLAL